jgi:hypothetical protein
MSGSKLRAAVAANDFKLFKTGMPKGFSGARELFNAIAKGLEKPMKKSKKTISEKAPPDEKAERMISKAKDSFQDRYGDNADSYLYGVAWKQYNKRHGIKTKTRLGEPITEERELDEAITIPKKAEVVGRNKEEKTVTVKWNDADGWHEEEIPEDELPGFYDRAAQPLKARKTDRLGNIMNPPKAGAEKKTDSAMASNKKNAQEIVDIFKKKPMKTPITVYGKKYGKTDDYEMVIVRRLYMGDEVYVVKSSGRFVEMRVGVSGLQIVDTKTKKILLDKGNDAIW